MPLGISCGIEMMHPLPLTMTFLRIRWVGSRSGSRGVGVLFDDSSEDPGSLEGVNSRGDAGDYLAQATVLRSGREQQSQSQVTAYDHLL